MRVSSSKVLGLSVVLVTLGCGGGGAVSAEGGGAQSDALQGDTPAQVAAAERLRPVADAVGVAAATDPGFSNVSEDPESGKVIVYRVGGNDGAASSSLVTMSTSGAQVEVRPAMVSALEATQLTAALDSDAEALGEVGVDVQSWGADGAGGAFHVGVSGDVAVARAKLQARYPQFASKWQVENVTIAPLTRLDDKAPFIGGSRIISVDDAAKAYSECSTGFAVRNSAGKYLTTAAHCNCSVNKNVLNGHYWNLGTFATAVDRDLDAAFIRVTNTYPELYSESRGDPTHVDTVTSEGHPRVGQHICTSGSFSDLRCGGNVAGSRHIRLRTCEGKHVVPVWLANQVNRIALAGQGDSGGPVIVRGRSNVAARGMISAGNLYAPAPCPESGTKRVCSWQVYFTDILPIAARHDFKF